MATLGFSTKWPKEMGGGNTNFISKIWHGIELIHGNKFNNQFDEFMTNCIKKGLFELIPDPGIYSFSIPKLHTIREDPKNLWVPGRKIHMVVFNRTKNRFQFAPVLEVKSVQYFQIIRFNYITNEDSPTVYIGDTKEDVMPFYFDDPKASYGIDDMKKLALNDGFNSIDHFFKWFNSDFTGKIIHWTDLRY